MIWEMTVSDLVRFSSHIPELAKLHNPLMAMGDRPSSEKPVATFNGTPIHNVNQLAMMMQSVGGVKVVTDAEAD